MDPFQVSFFPHRPIYMTTHLCQQSCYVRYWPANIRNSQLSVVPKEDQSINPGISGQPTLALPRAADKALIMCAFTMGFYDSVCV